MFNRLNFAQRLLLASIALVILMFQLYKFNEDGVTGSGWIFAFLIIGLLLLPILSGVQGKQVSPNKKLQDEIPKDKKSQDLTDIFDENFLNFNATQAMNRKAFEVIKIKTPDFMEQLNIWINFEADKLSVVPIVEDHLFFDHCCPFLFGIVSIAEYKKDAAFFSSKRFELLMIQVAKFMTDTKYNYSQKFYPEINFDKEYTKSFVMKKLGDIVPVVGKCMRNIMEDGHDPEIPLLHWFMMITFIDKLDDDSRQNIMSKLTIYTNKTIEELA